MKTLIFICLIFIAFSYADSEKTELDTIIESTRIDTSSSFSASTEEGDIVTDKNLNRKSSIKTFTFDGIHQIRGIVRKVKYYGPPGFGDNPKEDKLLTATILKLDRPIEVVETNPDGVNTTTTTTEVQLAAQGFYGQLDAAEKRHKEVTISGEFFSAHTGYHIRDLLMLVESVR